MKIRWSPTSISDLESIRLYIATDNPAASRRVATQIKQSVRRLSRFPLSGRAGRLAGTRELVIPGTPYIAAYAVRDKEVWIAAVLDGRRRWPEKFTGKP